MSDGMLLRTITPAEKEKERYVDILVQVLRRILLFVDGR